MSVFGQPDVAYTFDSCDRLTQITQGSATVTIGYDTANQRTSLTLPNGVSATYSHDNASRLTGITYQQGATSVGTLTYSYDDVGRVATRGGTLFQSALPSSVTSGTYDANNRLTQWVTPGGGITPSYDANGNLTNDGTSSFTWDARNRLLATSSGLSFAYDTFGRRTSLTSAGGTKTFLYSGADVVQELVGGTPTANLLTGPGSDERFTRTDSSNTWTFLTDVLGSTVALTDTTGAIATTYSYDPYGGTSAAGASNSNEFQYTGRENDGSGLYYYRARYYNPGWGRFISEDPLGVRAGINLYRYAGGNPLNFRDPSGLTPSSVQKPPQPPPTPATSSDTDSNGCATCVNSNSSSTDFPVGDNPTDGSGDRINTTLPGGNNPAQTANDKFNDLTGGDNTIDPTTGDSVGRNGVRLRFGDDGLPRIDIPGQDGFPHETIHFK
jgi:RHS repeat-associated protein